MTPAGRRNYTRRSHGYIDPTHVYNTAFMAGETLGPPRQQHTPRPNQTPSRPREVVLMRETDDGTPRTPPMRAESVMTSSYDPRDYRVVTMPVRRPRVDRSVWDLLRKAACEELALANGR